MRSSALLTRGTSGRSSSACFSSGSSSARVRSIREPGPSHEAASISSHRVANMHASKTIPAALLLAAALAPAQADEGMWTYNNFPADKVEKAYGFKPDQRWLDHLRLSSLRLARGCSGAFVSPQGLVQTNPHCARSCIQQLSTAAKNFIADGFYAREAKDEVKCPDVEVNQLVAITDVTERINKATAGKDA